MTINLVTYVVTIETPKGTAELDVPSTLGPEAAGRRAQMAAYAQRWGDVDEVTVVSVVAICAWFAGCDRPSEGTMSHPILGDVPICPTCREKMSA